jgi:hypothetical protein
MKRRLFLLISLAAAFASLPQAALAGTGHEFEKSFGPDGTSFSHFDSAGAVAVDEASYEVYVAQRTVPGAVSKFDGSGAPVDFTAGPGAGTNDISGFGFDISELGTSQIAVDPSTHDFYVADIGNAVIEAFHADGAEAKFTAGPGEDTNAIPALTTACGVAVDSNGDIYMGDLGFGVRVFSSAGEEITSFSVEEPCNVAVDSQGTVYVARYAKGAGTVEKFTPSEFPVSEATVYASGGVLDQGPAFAIALDPASDELYVVKHSAGKTNVLQYDQGGEITAEFGETGAGALTDSEGIAVDGSTGKVYASDTHGEEQVEIFAVPPALAPSVGESTASEITTTSANLHAEVNPSFFPTHFRFEYLSEAEYEANGESFLGAKATPETKLGSGGETLDAAAHVSGLEPDTAYRFRVLAANENGESTSAEPASRFVTYPAYPPGLPDGRAYEMVSPPRKLGEVFAPFQIGFSCEGCVPGESVSMMAMQSAADGDAVVYEGQPFGAGLSPKTNEYLSQRLAGGWGTQALSSAAASGYYLDFSADLERGILLQDRPALSPEAPTRGGLAFQNLYLRGPGGDLQPLVTSEPPQRGPEDFRVIYEGANAGDAEAAAFSHVIFEANDALTGEVGGIAPAAPEIGPEIFCDQGRNCNLYEWVGGEPRLVNVLPGNTEAATGAVLGSGYRLSPPSSAANEARAAEHAISDDGSKIFWSEEESGQTYVRIDGEETREIQDHAGAFLTASADGAKVLLSDGCLYSVEEEACEANLAQGEAAKFKGILGAAEDLSRVYFVDTAVLSGENDEGKVPTAGGFNLYGWEEGTTTFIGTLLGTDNEFTGESYGDWHAAASNRTARVSADGRFVAFISRAALTGYDNTRVGGGNCIGLTPACSEVFAYDAVSEELHCPSCNPSGQRPLGGSRLSLIRTDPANTPFRQMGNLSANGGGRLFFESEDALSPQDTNGGVEDVYQWEPQGIGDCQRQGGCVRLISSGHSPSPSLFIDSGASGDDAFFITREQLLGQDRDEQLDVYDARVGGGIAAEGETQNPECQGEACQPAARVPNDPTPASSSFSGAGNVKEGVARKRRCPKGKRKVRRNGRSRCAKASRGRAANGKRGGVK